MQKKKAYAVSTAHLDTVWRWDLRKTIEEYLPDTLRKNFDLIKRYPTTASILKVPFAIS